MITRGASNPDLEALVPERLRVIRVRAWSTRWTRPLRFGDLGLRAFIGLYRACRRLLESESFDLLFVTIFPTYPALIGPLVKRWWNGRFVLDYIDPWVGAWGLTVGGGKNRVPDFKSRLSRRVSLWLEPMAVRAADGISAVSAATYEAMVERIPEAKKIPCAEIPYGGERADFDALAERPNLSSLLRRRQGEFHLSYVGTLLPMGLETLRAFLGAVALLKTRQPRHYARLRVHFVGTSNQTTGSLDAVVVPEAKRLHVADVIDEVPGRVDYLEALGTLVDSDCILLLGSSEPHYTASKLYPAILARRPLLAVFHADSTVVSILERAARPPSARLVTYDDVSPAGSRVVEIFEALASLMEGPGYDPESIVLDVVKEYSARAMAEKLARLFDDAGSVA